MNYEIKSAREASLQEIFYDRNTNKLSYKDKLGIITVIDDSNSNCASAYKTSIFENYPYAVQPSMLKTCTSIEQNSNGMFPLGEKLQGYKVGGTLSLSDESFSNVIYLGTVDNFNFGFPWKLTGMVDAFDANFGSYLQSPLANGALVTDLTSDLAVPTITLNILSEYFTGGVDFYLLYVADTLNNISATISFEIEVLTVASDTPIFTFM
jgi:hypothetical protein